MAALNQALFVLQIASPAVVLLSALYVIPSRATLANQQSSSPITAVVIKSQSPRRALILSFLSLASLSFLADGLTFVVYAVLNKSWPVYSPIEISAVLGIIAYSGLAALGAYKDVKGLDVWSFKTVKAAITLALALDIATVVILGISFTKVSIPIVLHLAFSAFRVLVLVPLSLALFNPRVVYTPVESTSEVAEPQPTDFLLAPEPHHASTGLNPVSGKYGTFRSGRSTIPISAPTTRATTPVSPVPPSSSKKAKKEEIDYDPSWKEIGNRLKHLSPYLWPSGSRPLQLIALVCMLLLALGRVVNVFLPLSLGHLVRTLEENDGTSFWPYLISYVVLRFLQSSGGIAALRDSLWGPVMQYSDRAMSQLAFDHLLNLSLSFHIRRKTGEVLRILDRGAAINHIFELILFNIIPTFVDILIALVVFSVLFEWTLTVVIFVVMVAYVASSIILTRWRTKIRRQMNDRDIVTRGIHTDCLLNYETVKYFGGEQHEGERYREAIREYQALEYKVIVSLNLLNLVQNFITTLGLLVGCIIMARRVVDGRSRPSDFVTFITYLAQLYGPLSLLGTIYRSLNTSLIDTEKLLKLLNEPTDVNDKPNAPDLIIQDGELEFDNVSFSYDDKTTALQNVSFKIRKGSSVALVGESGSGKSTVLRLLYRFYDLKEGQGRILIDGQDIRDVTQSSLRKAIGVVPQDSVLFNSSIGYNIGYGKFGSTPEEIESAARAASLHERIMSFPKGYETVVGERGVRLSGGEKQRVAIARTLLKNPPILLLDEATSALDTSTEKDIQKAFETLVEGRSSLSIAHRLSTIAAADLILVLKDGQVVEAGTHAELVTREGVFASMWTDQISASDHVSVKRQSVTGYDLADSETPAEQDAKLDSPAVQDMPADVALEVEAADDAPGPIVDEPEPIAFPSSDNGKPASVAPSANGHVPSPPPKDNAPAPVSFPGVSFPGGGYDDDSQRAASTDTPRAALTPGVTFEAQSPPSESRGDTPDPEAEPKRKRISSQNFQRLARRISITTRRAGSTGAGISMPNIPGIPGFKRDSSGKSKDDAPVTDAPVVTDSPAGSVRGPSEDRPDASAPPSRGATLKKKDKKEKRKSTI